MSYLAWVPTEGGGQIQVPFAGPEGYHTNTDPNTGPIINPLPPQSPGIDIGGSTGDYTKVPFTPVQNMPNMDYTTPYPVSSGFTGTSVSDPFSQGAGNLRDPYTGGTLGSGAIGTNGFNGLFAGAGGTPSPVYSPDVSTGSIGGSTFSQYGFTGVGPNSISPISTSVDTGTANIPGSYGQPDLSSANAGTGQYSGGGFQDLGNGFARVTPDAGGSGVATTNTSPDTYGGSGGTPVQAGPGMPVADQGLATAANNAGTSISQAISGPETGAIKQAGSDVSQAGQTVATGVNTAANTVSATGVGLLAGIEKYVGEFFLYAAVLIVGVIFLAIGLSKFGGPKVYTARA